MTTAGEYNKYDLSIYARSTTGRVFNMRRITRVKLAIRGLGLCMPVRQLVYGAMDVVYGAVDVSQESDVRRRLVVVGLDTGPETNGDQETVSSPTSSRDLTASSSGSRPEATEEKDLQDPGGDEEGNRSGDSEDESVQSEGSLITASLHRISETVSEIGETMGQIEGKLEEKIGKIGEKMTEIEARLSEKVSQLEGKMSRIGEKMAAIEAHISEKVGKLEAEFEKKVESTKAKIEKVAHWAWKSLPFDKLPQWLQDNEYLTHEHRPPMNSFRGCFKSMFRMHTETWNIWTHFLGFIFFVVLCLGIYVYGDYITFLFEDIEVYQLPVTEQAMLFCFFLAAMICLSCSTMFHLFSNHSQGVYRIFSSLDYSGIAILITGSSIPAYYYGFYCSIIAQYTHMSIAFALCVVCVLVSLWKKFATPNYRPLRFATFVLFGLYGFIPVTHVALTEGVEKQHIIQAGTGVLTMAGVYILGATIYVLRFPERFFPGKFNTWASSHQIFHICVVCAALVHYDTLLSMIKYRMSIDSCAMEFINLPTLQV